MLRAEMDTSFRNTPAPTLLSQADLARLDAAGFPPERIPMQRLMISPRLRRALFLGRVDTIAQLAALSVERLLRSPGVGSVALAELQTELKRLIEDVGSEREPISGDSALAANHIQNEQAEMANSDRRDGSRYGCVLDSDYVARLAAAGLDAGTIRAASLPLGWEAGQLQRLAPRLTLADLTLLTWNEANTRRGLSDELLEDIRTEAYRLLARAQEQATKQVGADSNWDEATTEEYEGLHVGPDAQSDEALSEGDEEPLLGPDALVLLTAAGVDPNSIRLDSLGLSPRTINAFRRRGKMALGEVLALTRGQLLAIRGVGQGAIAELAARVEQVVDQVASWSHSNVYSSAPVAGDVMEGASVADGPAPRMAPRPSWLVGPPPSEPALGRGYLAYFDAAGVDAEALSIELLGLDARSRNCLRSAGIRTVAQLAVLPAHELLKMPNFGQKCLVEVCEAATGLLERLTSEQGKLDLHEVTAGRDPILGADYMECLAAAGLEPAELRLADFELSRRVRDALERAHIRTLAELGTLTERDILALPWMDAEGLADLRARTAELRVLALAIASTDPFAGVRVILDDLPPRLKTVLILRYGLDSGEPKTLEVVSTALDAPMTRERVRQIESDALRRLRASGIFRMAFVRAKQRVDAACQRLGLSPADERLDRVFAAEYPDASAPARVGYRLVSAVLGNESAPTVDLVGFDEAVVAVLARSGPLPLGELAERVMAMVTTEELSHRPDFSATERLRLVGPAVAGENGLYDLPSHPLPISRDKTVRRLGVMIAALERLGPSHFSTICAEANARLPAEYQLDERDTHAWLGRYTEHFTWAGRGRYGLVAQGVGLQVGRLTGGGDGSQQGGDEGVGDQGTGSAAAGAGTRVGLPHDHQRVRRGIGDEIAGLITERGPQPLDAIRAHVHSRFVVYDTSIDAAIAQDRRRRFVVRQDRLVALRAPDEAAATPERTQVRIMDSELEPLAERAVELVRSIRRDAETGFSRANEHALYTHAVVAALLDCADELAALERAPARGNIPERAWDALPASASESARTGTDTGVSE
jgi:DNA-directed RNA polymerase alpha subunit